MSKPRNSRRRAGCPSAELIRTNAAQRTPIAREARSCGLRYLQETALKLKDGRIFRIKAIADDSCKSD